MYYIVLHYTACVYCSMLDCSVHLVPPRILPYKIWWKPRFLMNERHLVEGCIANFGISLEVFEFLRFEWFFFRFSKKLGFWVYLVHPTVVSALLSPSVERCFVSRMRDFFFTRWNICYGPCFSKVLAGLRPRNTNISYFFDFKPFCFVLFWDNIHTVILRCLHWCLLVMLLWPLEPN